MACTPGRPAKPALRVYAGGETATNGDFATVIAHKLLLFAAVIIGLGFLLLMAFRSLLIPATAAVMNLLAAGAAFGVLVAIFQFGWGLRALNLGQAGPVESFLPVRPFYGLRGFPGLPDPRGMGRHQG